VKEALRHIQEKRETLTGPAFSVTVVGDACSGKTTLLNQLKTTGFTVRPEPDNPLLDLFKKSPEKYAYHNQLYKMTQLMGQELLGQESKTNSNPYFNESGVLATDVYNRYLHDQGLMTDQQYEDLNAMYTHYLDTMHKPDLIVYLYADDDIIRKRQIARDGLVVHDPSHLQPYWDRLLNDLQGRGIPVIKINTGGETVEQTQSSLLTHTEKMRRQEPVIENTLGTNEQPPSWEDAYEIELEGVYLNATLRSIPDKHDTQS